MQGRFGQDLDAASEELLKIGDEPPGKERAVDLAHIYQQVEVAVRPSLPAGHRTEYAHIPCAVPVGKAKDVGS